MSTGPLRRVIGTLGLIALAPVAIALGTGSLAPEDAALRAVTVGLVVVAVGRIARAVLAATLRRFETSTAADEDLDRHAAA